LRYLSFLVGVGVLLAMQLAMNASPAPRRCASVACCNCSKQKSSISLGAAEAGVMLIKARQVTTVTHSGFTFAPPSAILSTDVPKRKKPGLKPGF
jgi:hypothetical protein